MWDREAWEVTYEIYTTLLIGMLIGIWVQRGCLWLHRRYGVWVFRIWEYRDGQSRWVLKWEKKEAGK
jgi:hypothetical protein